MAKKKDAPAAQEGIEKALAILPASESFALIPKTLDEALRFAEIVSKTTMVPKDYQGNPGNVFVAVQMGLELGLPPLQALQNIAVINGRPSLWGDLALALVRNSKFLKEFDEFTPDQAMKEGRGWTKVQREGDKEPKEYSFSIDDAKRANLWGKQGTWTTYPGRMLQMRSRSFALRDKFTDVLKGLSIAEEAQDYVVEKNLGDGVDLVREAKGAIQPKAAVKEPEPEKKTEIKTEAPSEQGYLIEKVTKSAVNAGLYFVLINGKKYKTNDVDMARNAYDWHGDEVRVQFEAEGDTLTSILPFGIVEAEVAV